MPVTVFCYLLAAAALHAGWNALIRGAADQVRAMTAVAVGAALLAACLLPWLPSIQPLSWLYLLASSGIHTASYTLTGRVYREADLSQVYPLMRGMAPLLTALAAAIFLQDPVSWRGWGGIVLISGGIALLVLSRQAAWSRRGLLFALGNAVMITAYSMLDGSGARVSEAPASYACWVFLLSGCLQLAWGWRESAVWAGGQWPGYAWRGLLGGAGSVLAYGTALWAMTRAPLALVAALRECSIVFGMLIAALWLHERLGPRRILAAGLIVAGTIGLRLA